MRQHGFSLTELMVALALTSVMLLGLTRVYMMMSSQHLWLHHRFESRFDLMLVEALLAKWIDNAGFMGCQPSAALSWPKTKTVHGLTVLKANDKALPRNIKRRVKVGTDILKLQSMSFEHLTLTQAMTSPIKARINQLTPIDRRKKYIISDCDSAEPLFIKRIQQQSSTIYFKSPIKKRFPHHSFIGELKTTFIYVGKNKSAFAMFIDSHQGRSEMLSDMIQGLNLLLFKGKKSQLLSMRFVDKKGKRWTMVKAIKNGMIV